MLSELDNPHFFLERARESLLALANDYLRLAKCAIDRRRYSKRHLTVYRLQIAGKTGK